MSRSRRTTTKKSTTKTAKKKSTATTATTTLKRYKPLGERTKAIEKTLRSWCRKNKKVYKDILSKYTPARIKEILSSAGLHYSGADIKNSLRSLKGSRSFSNNNANARIEIEYSQCQRGDRTKTIEKKVRACCKKNNKTYEKIISTYTPTQIKEITGLNYNIRPEIQNSVRTLRKGINKKTAKGSNKKNKQMIPNETKVRKVFNDEEDGKPRPFNGEVTSYDKKTKKYTVEYEDGDEEEFTEKQLQKIIVKPQRKNKKRAVTTSKEQSTSSSTKRRKTKATTNEEERTPKQTTTRGRGRPARSKNNVPAQVTGTRKSTRGSSKRKEQVPPSSAELLTSDGDSDSEEEKGRGKTSPLSAAAADKGREKRRDKQQQLSTSPPAVASSSTKKRSAATKVKKKSLKNNKSKYIGERVSVQVDEWGPKPFNGIVEYESSKDELVVAYEDGTYEYFSSEASMLASGIKVGEGNDNEASTTAPRYDPVRLAKSIAKKGSHGNQFNWRGFGSQVGLCFNALPDHCSFLYGPLDADYVPKERKRPERRKKQTQEELSDLDTECSKGGEDKEGDENDNTALNKGKDVLDTDDVGKGKENEKGDNDSLSSEMDSDEPAHESTFDVESPDRDDGSFHSTANSDGSEEIESDIQPIAGRLSQLLQRKGGEIIAEAAESYEKEVLQPLVDVQSSLERRVEKANAIIERNKNTAEEAEDLAECFTFDIDKCKLTLKGMQTELFTTTSSLENLRSLQPHVVAECLVRVQSILTIRVGGGSEIVPTLGSIIASDDNTNSADTQEIDTIITKIMPGLEDSCEKYIESIRSKLQEQLESLKRDGVNAMYRYKYKQSLWDMKKELLRIDNLGRIAFRQKNRLLKERNEYPGDKKEFDVEFGDDLRRFSEKESTLGDKLIAALPLYEAAKEELVGEMKKFDSTLRKKLTVTIGSISIKPKRRDFDVDPLSHKDIRDEPDEGEEEDEEGEDSGDTQGALLHGKK